MNRQTTQLSVLAFVASSVLWLGGCGEFLDDPAVEIEESSPSDSHDITDQAPETDPSNQTPGSSTEDPKVDNDAQWSEPVGPRGGFYTELWAPGSTYFSVQEGVEGNSYLWRAASGYDWDKVELPADVSVRDFNHLVEIEGDLLLIGYDVLRSSDDGHSWHHHDFEGLNTVNIKVARVFDDALYVVVESGVATPHLFRITDDSTELIDDDLPTSVVDLMVAEDVMLLSRGFYGSEILIKTDDSDWESTHAPDATASDVDGIKLHVHDGVVYATSQAGVWRSFDGHDFQEITDKSAPEAVIVSDELIFGVVASSEGIASLDLSDAGANEPALSYRAGVGDAPHLKLATDGDSLVGSLHHTGLVYMDLEAGFWNQVSPTFQSLRSVAEVNGRSWMLSAQGALHGATDGEDFEKWLLDDDEGVDMAANGDGLYVVTRSGDLMVIEDRPAGMTLTSSTPLSDGRVSDISVYGDTVAISFAPKYLSGKGGTTAIGGGLYLVENSSTDQAGLKKIDSGLPTQYQYEQSAPVHAIYASDALLVVFGHDGIYRSEDQGQNWHKATVEQHISADDITRGRAWMVETDDALFAANYGRGGLELRRSDDDGNSFYSVDHTVPSTSIPTAIDAQGSTLLVATTEEPLLASTDGGHHFEPVGRDYRGGLIGHLDTDDDFRLRAVTSAGLVELPLH